MIYKIYKKFTDKCHVVYIWTYKAHNLAANQTNLTEKLKKLGAAEPIEPAFCKSDLALQS